MRNIALIMVFAVLMIANVSPVTACNNCDSDVYNVFNPTNIFKPNVNLHQNQQQEQRQVQYQELINTNINDITFTLPQDMNGIKISNTGVVPTVEVKALGVKDAQKFSRLVYPNEVLAFEATPGQTITIVSASDVALYTIGVEVDDVQRLNDINSKPDYNPIYHKMEWGNVVAIDFVNYFTSTDSLTASADATFFVIDNRAPMNTYTHVEYLIG